MTNFLQISQWELLIRHVDKDSYFEYKLKTRIWMDMEEDLRGKEWEKEKESAPSSI